MRTNTIEIFVNWGDTDKAGIVYYPNYFKWFDIGGHQFFRSCDLAPSYLEQEKGVILPMMEAKCSFLAPLYYEDIVQLKTAAEEIRNKTIRLKHEIIRDDTIIGRGHEIRGWVTHKEGEIKAVPIPSEVKQTLSANSHTDSFSGRSMYNA